MDKIYEIKEIIDQKILEEEFFKLSTDNALYLSTLTLDYIFLELLHSVFRQENMDIDHTIEDIRHSYREILKFIYKNKEIKNNEKILDADIDIAINLFSLMKYYNFFRNMVERTSLGILSAEEENLEVLFKYNENSCKKDRDFYVRIMDKLKLPYNKKSKLNTSSEHKILDLFCDLNINIDNYKSVNEKYIYSLIDKYQKYIIQDAEVEANYTFNSFSLEDFRKVYSILMAFSVLQARTGIISRKKNENPNSLIKEWDYSIFIKEISEYSKVLPQKVKLIIDNLVYDKEFASEFTTIYKPLLLCDGKIIFSSMMILISYAQDKFLFALNKENQNEKTMSKIAKDKENVMTSEIENYLKGKTDWKIKRSASIDKSNGGAEIDLAILYENTLFLIELKWFMKPESEKGHKVLDNKLNGFAANRLEKQKYIENNLERFVRNNFQIKISPNNVVSCLISKNYAGGIAICDPIPIIDQYLFFNICESCNFDLKKIIEEINNTNHLKNFQGAEKYETKNETFSLFNYQITAPIIVKYK